MDKKVLASFEIEGLDELIKDTGSLIKEQQLLRESSKSLDKTTDSGAAKFAEQSVKIKSLSKDISINNKLIQAATGVNAELGNELKREISTVSQARASNSELLKIRNELNLKTKEGQAAVQDINKKLDENNAFVKENVSQYEKQKIGIGDYSTAIKDAFKETGGFNSMLLGLTQTLSVFSPLTKALKSDLGGVAQSFKDNQAEAKGLSTANKLLATVNNATSASFKVLKLAIASTGIGLLLIALGSLVTFLTSTQRGMDAVTSVTRPLQAVFSAMLGVVQDLGESLFDLGKTAVEVFKNPKQVLEDLLSFLENQVVNRVKSVGVIFDAIRNGDFKALGNGLLQSVTGVENVVGKIENGFNNVSDRVSETTERLKEAAAIGAQIDKLKKAEVRAERDLILTRSEQLRIVKEQNKIAEDTTNTLSEREAATIKSIKASETLLKAEQSLLDKSIATKKLENSLNDTSIEDEKALNELIAQRVDKETQALELQTTQTNKLNTIRREAAANDLKAVQESINVANQELDLFIQTNKSKIEAGKELSDILVKQEIDRLNAIESKRSEILSTQRENNLITELEYLTKKYALEDEFNLERKALEEEKRVFDKAVKDEQALEELAEKVVRLEEEDATLYEVRQAQLERDTAEKIIQAENEINDKRLLEQRKNEIEKESKDASKAIKEEETKVRVDAAANAFGQIANLLGQETAAGKAAGIAQATISTYQGVTRVWESPSTLPEPFGTASKVLSTATVLASGLSSVKKIASTSIPKAARGIVLGGRSHAQGGTTLYDGSGNAVVEAEKGENMYVVNKNSSREINALSAWNVAGGGIPFSKPVSYAADGGLIRRRLSQAGNQVEVTNLNDIRVINVASETADVARQESIIVQNANL